MNKELIKKYQTEFDHFLNEGKLLTRTKSYFVWNDKINEDLMWNFEIKDIDIIIDDEYSELRKALCDGKTIQVYYKFNDTWNDTIKPEFKDNLSNYRIKPEEPEFKIGDFVKNESIGLIKQYSLSDLEYDKTATNINNWIKWEPSPMELCWFWSENKQEEATLSKFHSYTKHGEFKTIYYHFKYCEPFLNSKPSWFKD